MKANLLSILAAAGAATAQLSGRVGPTSTREAKAAKKVCSILDHGGVASATTDNSAALTKAWEDCKNGGQVFIPSGSYGLEKWVDLSGGKNVSINLEGVIYRIVSGTAAGSLITVQGSEDFELYSGNSKGAIQAYGFEFHKQDQSGPGILKISNTTDFSVHGIALVDSPSVHFALDTSVNGEVYNMIIHGSSEGGLDGVAVSGTNVWVHDLEVSNEGECVSVKSPSKSLLVESVFCNLSGGCSLGPLGVDTSVRDIVYQNVYSQGCDHMMAIKSNGGSGSLFYGTFANFIGRNNARAIKLDAFSPDVQETPGDGIDVYELAFQNWTGTVVDGSTNPPIDLACPGTLPCGNLLIEDFNIWTETGTSQKYVCKSAYGQGACMNQFAGNGAYTTTMSVATMDAAKYAAPTMAAQITKGLGVTTSIEIPAVPTSFFPGLKPASSLLAKPSS